MGKRYVAYVGSYTFIGKSKGITIYDVDVDAGRFTKRNEVEINNSSYLAVSHSRKYLYSVVDEGIASTLHRTAVIAIDVEKITGKEGLELTRERPR